MTTQQSWEEESKEAHFNAEGFNYCVAHNEGQECCVESEWFKAYISKVEKEAKERGREEVKQRFNLKELSKDWEEGFYDSDWQPHTIQYTELEAKILERLTDDFLPRHMPVYAWNKPYADKIILIVRQELMKSFLPSPPKAPAPESNSIT